MEVRIGVKSPHVGSWSRVHSIVVLESVDSSTVQVDRAYSMYLIWSRESVRFVPVITSFLVLSSKVNDSTSPTGSV